MIHNIELNPGQGAKLVRSAGSYAQLMSRDGKYAIVKMPSGETRMILQSCRATVGIVSNVEHNLEVSGKAGRSRWLGRRPRTRGVVMNPVDHPMGGGEGRQSGGHPRSRKGMPAKGYKTRSPKKQSSKYIVERRKKSIRSSPPTMVMPAKNRSPPPALAAGSPSATLCSTTSNWLKCTR